MANADSIYKCSVCGNVVSVVEPHQGTLVCCGENMKLMQAKTLEQEGKEKHVPVVETSNGKVVVKVGSVPHPMEEKHWIELIQILRNNKVIAEKHLFPGQEPKAEFCIENTKGLKAREFCNVHGFYKQPCATLIDAVRV